MSTYDPNHKWTAIAWGAVGVAFFVGGSFGGCNGSTNYYDRRIAEVQAQAAITIAKERAKNVESRLLSLEAYHRPGPAKAMGRAESKAQPIEDRGSDKGRGTAPKE